MSMLDAGRIYDISIGTQGDCQAGNTPFRADEGVCAAPMQKHHNITAKPCCPRFTEDLKKGVQCPKTRTIGNSGLPAVTGGSIALSVSFCLRKKTTTSLQICPIWGPQKMREQSQRRDPLRSRNPQPFNYLREYPQS